MFKTAKAVREFVMAGKAVVTVTSKVTQASFTFRITQAANCEDRRFVSVLTGPDNTSDYTYLGTWDAGANEPLRLTAKSRFSCDAPSYKAARYLIANVVRYGELPDGLEVRHEGRCGRCARALTVPESIDRGIGPECWEKMAA